MVQGEYPQERVQAIRSVNKSIPPNAVPPATPDEIYHVDTHPDPDTQKEIVLWDDILQAFDKAVQVRHKSRVVPFLKGKDFTILQPRRIAAMSETILDVIVDTPMTVNEGSASPKVRQLELQKVASQDGSTMNVEVASEDAIPAPSATSTPITTTATSMPNASSSSRTESSLSTSSTATSTVRRNPVYGLVEIAMENYTHIDRPLAFPSARGPHAVLDDRTPVVEDLPTTPCPGNDNRSQLRRPQIATTNVPVEMQWAQTVISASHGDKDAQVMLGDMYRDGKGVPQDYQAAMDWYLKAVEQGDAAGQQRVGGLYDKGFGVPQNYLTAMQWYHNAAEQGHAVAQHCIGVLYDFGHGVRQDYLQAMNWYLKAASQGHTDSQYNIGVLFRDGRGVPQDFAQAMDWFLKAAQQGHAFAQNSIGVLYGDGQGVPQDDAQAMEWFLMAAQQGHAFAQNNIGFLYHHSRGVPQDFAQAMNWYVKSSKQGNEVAQYNIGLLYNNGLGVPQDYSKAAEWFSKAADQGHDLAMRWLEALKKKGVC